MTPGNGVLGKRPGILTGRRRTVNAAAARPSFRRKPESILISGPKIKMGPGFRRDDEVGALPT
jgi:hypothetical protein